MKCDSKETDRLLEQQGYSKEQINNMYKNFVMGFDGSKLPSIGVTIKIEALKL